MINIPGIFKSASLGNLSSSAGGIKMTVYYLDGMKIIAIARQYWEENVLGSVIVDHLEGREREGRGKGGFWGGGGTHEGMEEF